MASELFASTIAADGLVHVFGSGHSRMNTEEMFPRIGSFPGFHPIAELAISNHVGVVGPNGLRQAMFLEKVDGFGGSSSSRSSPPRRRVPHLLEHRDQRRRHRAGAATPRRWACRSWR